MKPARHPAIYAKFDPERRKELIGTYELSAGIFKESGMLYSIPKLYNTLTHICGKPAIVWELFFNFLNNALTELLELGYLGVIISHAKNHLHRIFKFQVHKSTAEPVLTRSLWTHIGSIQLISRY